MSSLFDPVSFLSNPESAGEGLGSFAPRDPLAMLLAQGGVPRVSGGAPSGGGGGFKQFLKNAAQNFLTGMGDTMQINAGMVPLRIRQAHEERQRRLDALEEMSNRAEALKNIAMAQNAKLNPETTFDAGVSGIQELRGIKGTAAQIKDLADAWKAAHGEAKKKEERKEILDFGQGPKEYATDYDPNAPEGQQYSLPGKAGESFPGKRFVDRLRSGEIPPGLEKEPQMTRFAHLLAKQEAGTITPQEKLELGGIDKALKIAGEIRIPAMQMGQQPIYDPGTEAFGIPIFNRRKGTVDITPMVPGPTMQERTIAGQALKISDQINEVEKQLNDPETSKLIGPIIGRAGNKLLTDYDFSKELGYASPDQVRKFNDLRTSLRSLAAMQAIIHGYRGGEQVYKTFSDSIGGPQRSAQALRGSLDSIDRLAAIAYREGTRGAMATKAARESGGVEQGGSTGIRVRNPKTGEMGTFTGTKQQAIAKGLVPVE